MEKIRMLTEADREAVIDLNEFAFQYTIPAKRMEQLNREIDSHFIWGYTVEGEVAGKVHILPFRMFIGGKEIASGGIGAVSTWPEYRRLGIAKKLMHRSLVDMKEKGMTVSFLHPFHVGFYRKLGWEVVVNHKQYTIPTADLHTRWQAEGYVRRIKDDISLLDRLYQSYAKQYNGMLFRDETWWQEKVLADSLARIAVAYHDRGQAIGYVIYKVREERFTVIDFAYTSLNAYRLLMAFIANHDSMAKEVVLTASEDDPLPLLLENPRFENKNHPYFMGRIVDVQGFLQELPVNDVSEAVTVTVEDEFFNENNGTYTLGAKQGKLDVTKVSPETKGQVHCSIQQLTVICMGHARPRQQYALGFITGEEKAIETLEKIMPQGKTFLADFF